MKKSKFRMTDILCTTSIIASIAVSVSQHVLDLKHITIKVVMLIAHVSHMTLSLCFFVCIRLEAARSYGALRKEIETVVSREHLKIRRVLHDLKQPAALVMCVSQEEPLDRPLLNALCLQWSTRIKSVNEIQTDKSVKPYVVVGIHDLIEHLALSYGRLFTARGVKFNFCSEVSKVIMVYALTDNINRAVENLLSNANKFTSDGGEVLLSVWIKQAVSASTPGQICISVKDSGKGFKQGMSDTIWTENYKGQIDSIGSGMGLPSVKEFALQEGGTVWAKSNEGRGVTVGFSVRCLIVDETTRNAVGTEGCFTDRVSSRNSSIDEFQTGEQKFILLVEDDALQMRVNLKKMKRAVADNVCIRTANEGCDGLVKLRSRRFDAVITDMNMPVMDGATMIKLAREEGILPRITKLLSAQTFPAQHFESFGVEASMMYDKTDTFSDVFADVAAELLIFDQAAD